MKQFLFIFLTISLLTNCSNKETSNVVEKPNNVARIKQNFIHQLPGIWVLTDYINDIEKTRSPIKSSDKLHGIVSMRIKEDIKTDSIDIGASWNNHEGYNFTAYLKSGQNKNSLKTSLSDYNDNSNFYELGYEIINNETYLFLYHYNKQNKLIDKRKFTKIADEQPDDDIGWGLQYIVNQKLFSGNFLFIDSVNNRTTVSLKSDGSLAGHPDFNEFYIFTDFMGGPETSLDEICFNQQSKSPSCFAFQFNNDTIYLYSTRGDEEGDEDLQHDKLRYKLVKQ